MTDKEKQEKFIKYKMKSSIIKYGWYALYPFLLFLMLGFFFSYWLFLGIIISAYPLWIMTDDIKRYKKELRELKNLSTEDKEKETDSSSVNS